MDVLLRRRRRCSTRVGSAVSGPVAGNRLSDEAQPAIPLRSATCRSSPRAGGCRAGRARSGRRRRGRRRRAARAPVTVTISGTGLVEWAVFGRAVGLEHLLGVAVVGGDRCRRRRSRGPRRRPRPSRASTSSTAVDRRRDHAGVPDHVGVGEVDDPEAVAVVAPALRELAGGGRGAHLGLVVVGGDVAGRVDQAALLPLPLLLAAAVEEVGDVRVLLGLGDVQLALAAARRSPRRGSSPARCGGKATG